MIFASAGFNVRIYDIAQAQIKAALEDIASQLRILEKDGLIRGTLSVGIQWFFLVYSVGPAVDRQRLGRYMDPCLLAEKQIAAITGTDDLAEAIKDTIYIQESVPENLELKQKVLTQIMENTTSDDVIISSSTSCLMPSKLFAGLKR